jgi:CrcB protein
VNEVKTFWAVALGAGVGGVSRYLLASAIQQRAGTSFPWGTFVVNVSGSLLLGFLIRYALATPSLSV